MRRGPAPAVLALLASACGGGSPTGPSPQPSATPPPGHTVVAVVFYDENGDGRLQDTEHSRIPGAKVVIGGRAGTSAKLTGRAVVTGVPAGPQTAAIEPGSLPPFYRAGAAASVEVPTGADVLLAVTLPIGRNRPNVYMAFGDSITVGDGSTDGNGYVTPLAQMLREHFGRATVVNRGADATRSTEGIQRIERNLGLVMPAETLILYGTNDWVECRGAVPCITIDSLRAIVERARDARSLPFLATIIPVNPARNPPERNQWISQIDVLIRALAAEQGAVLVDLEAAFLRNSDLTQLYSDHVHPNDRGYRIIAEEFFEAITLPAGSSSSFDVFASFGPEPPGAGE